VSAVPREVDICHVDKRHWKLAGKVLKQISWVTGYAAYINEDQDMV
jgi:hypothetical protein